MSVLDRWRPLEPVSDGCTGGLHLDLLGWALRRSRLRSPAQWRCRCAMVGQIWSGAHAGRASLHSARPMDRSGSRAPALTFPDPGSSARAVVEETRYNRRTNRATGLTRSRARPRSPCDVPSIAHASTGRCSPRPTRRLEKSSLVTGRRDDFAAMTGRVTGWHSSAPLGRNGRLSG